MIAEGLGVKSFHPGEIMQLTKDGALETGPAALIDNPDAPVSRRFFLQASAGAMLAGAAAVPHKVFASPAADIDALDAMGQAELLRNKQVTALELLNACVARSERLNPQLNAVVTQFLDRARATAKSSLPQSPLSGVPYLIKDLFSFKGERQTAGARLLANYIATDTSPAAEAAVKAGLVVFGKTNTSEAGLLPSTESVLFGPVHNPWRLDYSAGGSSGGAAAAVASGILPIAHASDAGGSIRIPAAFCGIFGLKTSRFRVPNPDPMEGAPDVEFCVSRSVRDSAMMLSLAEDRRSRAPLKPVGFVSGAATRRLKIAFCTQNMFGAEPDPQIKALTEDTARLCASLGHEIIEVKNPIDGEGFMRAASLLWAIAPAWAVNEAKKQHLKPEDVLEPWTLGLAAQMEGKPKAAIAPAAAYLKQFQHQIEAFMSPHDLWLTPVTFDAFQPLGYISPTVPFDTLLARVKQSVSYTVAHNAAGTPAMSVPLQWTNEGFPVGSQFAAKLGEEAMLLSLAYELEAARPWSAKRPTVSAISG